MKRLCASLALVGAILACAPAHAGSGCELVSTGAMPGACRYVATGPGVYEVETASGYRIQASDDRGATWHILAAQPVAPNSPASGVALVQSGALKTTPGELVEVGLGTGGVVVGGGTVARYQDGHIKAGDA